MFVLVTCGHRIHKAIFVWPWTNENARTKQVQQTNGKRAIWSVYRTDTNARGFQLVQRMLGLKSVMLEDFLEITRYFALTSYCNTIGQSNDALSVLGFSLTWKRRGDVLIFSSICWWNKQWTLTETIFQGQTKIALSNSIRIMWLARLSSLSLLLQLGCFDVTRNKVYF